MPCLYGKPSAIEQYVHSTSRSIACIGSPSLKRASDAKVRLRSVSISRTHSRSAA